MSCFPELVLLTTMPSCLFRKVTNRQHTVQGMWKVRREKDAVDRQFIWFSKGLIESVRVTQIGVFV